MKKLTFYNILLYKWNQLKWFGACRVQWKCICVNLLFYLSTCFIFNMVWKGVCDSWKCKVFYELVQLKIILYIMRRRKLGSYGLHLRRNDNGGFPTNTWTRCGVFRLLAKVKKNKIWRKEKSSWVRSRRKMKESVRNGIVHCVFGCLWGTLKWKYKKMIVFEKWEGPKNSFWVRPENGRSRRKTFMLFRVINNARNK